MAESKLFSRAVCVLFGFSAVLSCAERCEWKTISISIQISISLATLFAIAIIIVTHLRCAHHVSILRIDLEFSFFRFSYFRFQRFQLLALCAVATIQYTRRLRVVHKCDTLDSHSRQLSNMYSLRIIHEYVSH